MCRNNCGSTCQCTESQACINARKNFHKRMLGFVSSYSDLKNILACKDELEDLMHGQLIYVSSVNKYVKFDGNEIAFYEANIPTGSKVTLP